MTTPLTTSAQAALELRPYQRAALAAIEQAHASGRRAGLVCLPTGTGKTVLFSELTRRWDTPTVILAHRDELLTQARDKLCALWPAADVGLLGGGRHDMGHRVTIASVQALMRPRWLAEVAAQGIRLVIVDEAHHTPARSYVRVLEALGAGQGGHGQQRQDAGDASDVGAFLMGVTATPQRFDEVSLAPIFGDAVYVATLPQMVAEGWLADLRGVRLATGVSLDGVHTRGGDFLEGELAETVDTPERNALIVSAYLRHARGASAIAFCASVAHAEHLAQLFAAAGARAAVVSGQTPKPERDRLLSAYVAGDVDVVCNCQVLTEGFDAPVTSCIILARPTRSQGLYLQMVGRGTRPAPGKRACVVLDVADASGRHSLVQLPDLLGRAYAAPDQAPDQAPAVASTHAASAPRQAPQVESEQEDAPATWSLHDALTALERDQGAPPSPTERAGRLVHQWGWKRVGSAYVLTLDAPPRQQTFTLEPSGGEQYMAYRQTGQARERLTPTALPLGWAQALVEATAERLLQGDAVLVDRDAPWRAHPASEKQLWLLRKKRIAVPTGCTKGQAADLLATFFARQKSRAG